MKDINYLKNENFILKEEISDSRDRLDKAHREIGALKLQIEILQNKLNEKKVFNIREFTTRKIYCRYWYITMVNDVFYLLGEDNESIRIYTVPKCHSMEDICDIFFDCHFNGFCTNDGLFYKKDFKTKEEAFARYLKSDLLLYEH